MQIVKSKEEMRLYNNQYYSDNKQKLRERNHKWNENNYEKRMLAVARCRARIRNLEFNITSEDIKIPDICPYLQITLTRLCGQGRHDSNASLDRIDSSKGYTKDNIEIISALANKMRQNATAEQLILFAKNILKRGF